MKNTKRVRRNTTTKTTKLKSEIQSRNGRLSAKDYQVDVRLALHAHFGRPGKMRSKCLIEDIGINEEEWAQVCRADFGKTIPARLKFIAMAIREKLAQSLPPPAGSVPKYCLSLIEWTGPKVMTVGEIDVTGLQFEILQKKASMANDDSFDKALKNALEVMTENNNCELENAVAENNALLQLLAEHMELNRMESDISSFSGDESGPLTYGIFKLIGSSQKRLTKAMQAAPN